MKKYLVPLLLIVLFLISGCTAISELSITEEFELKKNDFPVELTKLKDSFSLYANSKVENFVIDSLKKEISLYFNKDLSLVPFREEIVSRFYSELRNYFGERFSGFNYKIFSNKILIEDLIPNYFRTDKTKIDKSRLPKSSLERRIPLIKNTSRPFEITNGLYKQNILLWHSHGWYYNNTEKRWMWQRARLFQTVEDKGPLMFTIPYLIPMLENAGAIVFVPRERDTQINEVIVDNDFGNTETYLETSSVSEVEWKTSNDPGFALRDLVLKDGDNPFKQGTSRYIFSSIEETAAVKWIPDIPEDGDYAVYISYSSSVNNVSDAKYLVKHAGGVTQYSVNQTIGGGTWLYLGTFHFKKGRNPETGVVLSNESNEKGKTVSADAVRFGGGMGIIEREGLISERPKYIEGSRYWLQFAGMPDTLVYNLNKNQDDYKDDYQSRAEYGNYLCGQPFGPNRNRNEKGLGVPIDVSIAFHTDAGITRNDTVVGTLMIYSVAGSDSLGVFPDSVSRLANRDFADIVQTQLVEDIKLKYDSAWSRRQLWDAMYSEAARPNFPSLLLELLSHQNFLDMKFALDPRFRFDVSRAIYKGILKFLSSQYGYEYVIQPLPVTHFSTEFNENGSVKLKWKPDIDELESTATPDAYIVYTKIDDGGFDKGRISLTNEMIIDQIEKGKVYSFKVTALNKGGESFPSEVLSVCRINDDKPAVLVVNGFDRVAAPETIESKDFLGFVNFIDEGVPDKYDYGFTGGQFNYDPDSKWETDDNPGHGTSSAEYETKIIAGNTFDFTGLHGKALVNNGFSFCSSSDESVMDGSVDLNKYSFVDLILGEEKKTFYPKQSFRKDFEFETFPIQLREKIKSYLSNGKKMFLSGSYVSSDLYSFDEDSSGIQFANDILKIKFKAKNADGTGEVFTVPEKMLAGKYQFRYNSEFSDSIYKVEAPDEIGPVNGSEVLMRFAENNFSAAIGYKKDYGIVSFSFPFETILGEKQRNEVMKLVINYLEVK
jgi:hypothetical protein